MSSEEPLPCCNLLPNTAIWLPPVVSSSVSHAKLPVQLGVEGVEQMNTGSSQMASQLTQAWQLVSSSKKQWQCWAVEVFLTQHMTIVQHLRVGGEQKG